MTAKKFPVLKVLIDGDGNVCSVTNMMDEKLTDNDYGNHPETGKPENKRIDQHGVLASENYCRWKLIGGRWVCT